MLEGLEATEVRLSNCLENKDFRTDSSFYTTIPLVNPNLEYKRIGECLLSSQYGISISMNEEGKGTPIYRMNEIHDLLCDLEVSKYADISTDKLSTFVLRDKDVLFNRTNSFEWVGRTGIYYHNDDIKRVFASYLVRLTPNTSIILPEYLTAFLNSKFGMADIKRRARQSINQTNVNPEEVKEIKIPILDMDLQQRVAEHLQGANKKRITAQNLYNSAGQELLECLGLQNFEAKSEAYNIKSLKESFLATGRIDAEYYLPKYEDYRKLVESYAKGFAPLSEVCEIKDTNYIPEDKINYRYIELANIGISGDITGCDVQQGKDLPTRARRVVSKGDVIVSSIEGSLGSCALVTEEYNGALCSTGFYVLRSSRLNSETLLTLFKSIPMQQLLKKGCSGTILTGISRTELEQIPIPLIRPEVQAQIAEYVQRSVVLRLEAKALLEQAKLSVEQVVETGGVNR